MEIVKNVQKIWSLLIIAPKNRWQDGLRILLQAIPQVKQVEQTDNLHQGVTMVCKHNPTAVFVDAELLENMAWEFAIQIKAEFPETPCILMVKDQKQKNLAHHLGADAVLFKEFTQQTLQHTLTKLLCQPRSIQTKPLGI